MSTYSTIFTSEKANENDSADVQCEGPSLGSKASSENDDKPARSSLAQQGNVSPDNEVKDIQVKQADKTSMVDQLALELGKHALTWRRKS